MMSFCWWRGGVENKQNSRQQSDDDGGDAVVVDVAVAIICIGTSDCNTPTEIQLQLYEEI